RQNPEVRELRAIGRQPRLSFQIQAVKLLERVVEHNKFRVEQVDQRQVLYQQLLEKRRRLIVDRRLKLGVVVLRKERRIRLDTPPQLADLQPLVDKLPAPGTELVLSREPDRVAGAVDVLRTQLRDRLQHALRAL